MAWRQRNSGVPAFRPNQTNRPVFEDFDPKIDTNENEGARVVVLHVPGFVKEQMKITFERGNSIRVQGQRALLNNKWSRFNQVILVPVNCEANKIHAKYHLGALTITMPKTLLPSPSTADKSAEKTSQQNVSQNIPPTKPAETKASPPSPIPRPTQKAPEAVAQMAKRANEAIVERALKKAGDEDQKAQKRIDEPKEKKASSEPKAEKGPEVTPPSQSHSEIKNTDETSAIKKPDIGKGSAQVAAAAAAASKVLDVGKKVVEKLAPAKEKNHEKATNENKLGMKYIAESAKQRVVSVTKRLNNDDRQSLINIGAAVMVLVALGAYISYASFGSSSENEN